MPPCGRCHIHGAQCLIDAGCVFRVRGWVNTWICICTECICVSRVHTRMTPTVITVAQRSQKFLYISSNSPEVGGLSRVSSYSLPQEIIQRPRRTGLFCPPQPGAPRFECKAATVVSFQPAGQGREEDQNRWFC